MKKRFEFMRFMGTGIAVGGILVGGLAVATFMTSTSVVRFEVLIGSIVSAALAISFGLLIEVILAIEENTRATSEYLEKLTSRQRPAASSSDVPEPTMEQLRGGKQK